MFNSETGQPWDLIGFHPELLDFRMETVIWNRPYIQENYRCE